MPDPTPPAPAPVADPVPITPTPAPTPSAPVAPNGGPPPDVLARELEQARKDAASYREKLRAREKADEERAADEAKKKGEFEKLYGETKSKLDAQTTELERYRKAQEAARERELTTVPEAMRKFAPADPEQFAEWLTATRSLAPAATPPKPPVPSSAAPRPADPGGQKRTFSVAEIEAMSFDERSKLMPEINAAMREGRITQ